jgi:hypothetical protein
LSTHPAAVDLIPLIAFDTMKGGCFAHGNGNTKIKIYLIFSKKPILKEKAKNLVLPTGIYR